MVQNSRLLMTHLRNQLFKPQKTNRQMAMLVVGPANHGKTTLLQHLVLHDESSSKSKDVGRSGRITKPSNVVLRIFIQIQNSLFSSQGELFSTRVLRNAFNSPFRHSSSSHNIRPLDNHLPDLSISLSSLALS